MKISKETERNENKSYCILYSPIYFDLPYHGFEDLDFGIPQIIFTDSLAPSLAVNIPNRIAIPLYLQGITWYKTG